MRAAAVVAALIVAAAGLAGVSARRTTADPAPTLLLPPSAPPAALTLGPESAPHTLTIWSDYECSACGLLEREAGPALRRLAESGRIRLELRHFPLRAHRRAPRAVAAALCAERQGGGWRMHEALTATVAEWARGAPSSPRFTALADSLGLDHEALGSCLGDDQIAGLLAGDLALGRAQGLVGVPAVFLDGRPLTVRTPRGLVRRVERAALIQRP